MIRICPTNRWSIKGSQFHVIVVYRWVLGLVPHRSVLMYWVPVWQYMPSLDKLIHIEFQKNLRKLKKKKKRNCRTYTAMPCTWWFWAVYVLYWVHYPVTLVCVPIDCWTNIYRHYLPNHTIMGGIANLGPIIYITNYLKVPNQKILFLNHWPNKVSFALAHPLYLPIRIVR